MSIAQEAQTAGTDVFESIVGALQNPNERKLAPKITDAMKKAILEGRTPIRDTVDIPQKIYVSEQHEKYIQNQGQLKMLVSTFYDSQDMRIRTGNRIVGNFRLRVGDFENQKQSEKDNKLINKIVGEYNLFSEELVTNRQIQKHFEIKREGVIATAYEWTMVDTYVQHRKAEIEMGKKIKTYVKDYPIFHHFLQHVKGCGPSMAAVFIAKLDPYVAKHISAYWRYCGVGVRTDIDGKGDSIRDNHLIIERYVDKNENINFKKSVTMNPFVKSKLLGVLAGGFLKAKDNPDKYNLAYYAMRERYDKMPEHKDKKIGHKHAMARRYAAKLFLADLWIAQRTLEGLPVTKPYHEAKLGLKH